MWSRRADGRSHHPCPLQLNTIACGSTAALSSTITSGCHGWSHRAAGGGGSYDDVWQLHISLLIMAAPPFGLAPRGPACPDHLPAGIRETGSWRRESLLAGQQIAPPGVTPSVSDSVVLAASIISSPRTCTFSPEWTIWFMMVSDWYQSAENWECTHRTGVKMSFKIHFRKVKHEKFMRGLKSERSMQLEQKQRIYPLCLCVPFTLMKILYSQWIFKILLKLSLFFVESSFT